ncbi:MAG: hypothetical protein JNJ46_35080 [Myxococcales bacterium]|nr:hypothetical protein [Myxococcales bacterium]
MKGKQCAACGTALPSNARSGHRYCGVRCRVRAYRLRQTEGSTTQDAYISRLQRECDQLVAGKRKLADRIAELKGEITELNGEITELRCALLTKPHVPASQAQAIREAKEARQQADRLQAALTELHLENVKRLDAERDRRDEHRKALDDAKAHAKAEAEKGFAQERGKLQEEVRAAKAAEQAARNTVTRLANELRQRPTPSASPVTVATPHEVPWRDALTDSVRQEEELWAKLQQRRKELGLPLLGRFMRGEAAAPEQAAVLAFRRRADRYYDGENEGDESIVWTEVRCRLDAASERVLLDKSAAKIAGYQLKLEQLQRRP